MSIDFRKCLSALSDVIMNRPAPIRVFDQIYMKIPDILLHADLIGRWFDGRKIAFIGDGDAVALSLVYLSEHELIRGKNCKIEVFDFDERQVNSINFFAEKHSLGKRIKATLYNVFDPIPKRAWQAFDGFHTNPPWGASNGGRSVLAFVRRGVEACKPSASGCVVIADSKDLKWCVDVLANTQRTLMGSGFRVSEMIPSFHSYHLDDDPTLKSCALVVARDGGRKDKYRSLPLSESERINFYGRENSLHVKYVRDCTAGGKFQSKDYTLEKFED